MSTALAVRERPILFSGAMVRAILDGRKTQTRRVVKPQPPAQFPVGWVEGDAAFWSAASVGDFPMWERCVVCPHGQCGDWLWVRETLTRSGGYVQYAADHATTRTLWPADWKQDPRPSIHMNREHSRISLELTAVRVERVQDITPEDCEAEGIHDLATLSYDARRTKFSLLWDSLNAARGFGWDKNPWVWVLTFKRLSPVAVAETPAHG